MKFHQALATLFGIGHAPVAPGSVASAAALILAWPIVWWGGHFLIFMAGLAAGAAGAWACGLYTREKKEADPSACVVDELAGQWIACAFAPLSFPAFILAFALFRLLDIAKPWPISRLERLAGGLGIMADDLAAGLAAGAIIATLAHAGLV